MLQVSVLATHNTFPILKPAAKLLGSFLQRGHRSVSLGKHRCNFQDPAQMADPLWNSNTNSRQKALNNHTADFLNGMAVVD